MKVAIIGAANTKFGELWKKSLTDLLAESQLAAIADAKISVDQIDAIFTGNMCAGIFSNQSNVGAIASSILNLNVESYVVQGACASGGLALRAGINAIKSGEAEVVLVNGVEKMTDVGSEKVLSGLSSAASFDWEQIHGATFPVLNAMIARFYMKTYGLTREQLAQVSVQNHENGFLNPKAHLRKKVTVEDVLNSPMVADPLTLLDCSPISDGAASLILCSEKFLAKRPEVTPVFITGSACATDTLILDERKSLLEWKATQIAAKKAYKQAGVSPEKIDVVELHDAFSIVQILSLKDLGLSEKNLVVNPSGGLKSRGHPVGATGVAQAVEIVNQLHGSCGERQVKDAKVGLTHNVGGCGSTVVVNVFEKL